MASNDMQYTGHGENTGGLQRHSLGDFYPWISVTLNDGQHYFMHGGTGEEGPRFSSFKWAKLWLDATLEARRQMAVPTLH